MTEILLGNTYVYFISAGAKKGLPKHAMFENCCVFLYFGEVNLFNIRSTEGWFEARELTFDKTKLKFKGN